MIKFLPTFIIQTFSNKRNNFLNPFKYILLFQIIFYSLLSFSQYTYQKTIGGLQNDEAYSVIKAIDNGYIICGYTTSNGAGGQDVLVVKVDDIGNVIWAKTYGGINDEQFGKIIATKDNSYLIFCDTYSFGQGDSDILLIKIDINGNFIWSEVYGTTVEDRVFDVTESDNGFIIVGSTKLFDIFNRDGLIINIDKTGSLIWSTSYSQSGALEQELFGVIKSFDNNYIIIGTCSDYNINCWKIDILGNVIWYKVYSGDVSDWARSITYSNDSCYIISGSSNSFSNGYLDFLALKIDENSNLIWAKTFGGNDDDRSLSVCNVNNNGYLMTGFTSSFGYVNRKIYSVRIDNDGNLLWSKAFGGNEPDDISHDLLWWCLKSALPITNKSFLISGFTKSFGVANKDIYLIKTDSLGNTLNCPTLNPNTISKTVNLTESPGAQLIRTLDMITVQPDLIVNDIKLADSNVCKCNLIVSLGKDTSICMGQSLKLSVISSGSEGTITYNWSSCPIGLSSTDSVITVTPTVSTTYTATISDSCTSKVANIKVTISPAISLTAKANDIALQYVVCPRSSTKQLNLSSNGSVGSGCSNWQYSWYNGSEYWTGSDFNSATEVWNSSYANISYLGSDSVKYTVKARCLGSLSCGSPSSVYTNIIKDPSFINSTYGSPPNGPSHFMHVNWGRVNGASYKLQYSKDKKNWVNSTFSGTKTFFNHNAGDYPNGSIFFRVQTYIDSDSCSDWVTLLDTAYTACDFPVLAATIATENSIGLVLYPDNNPDYTTYSIALYNQNYDPQYVQADGTLNSNNPIYLTSAAWGNITVKGLNPETNYCFYATAMNKRGNLQTEGPAKAVCLSTLPCTGTAPFNLSGVVTYDNNSLTPLNNTTVSITDGASYYSTTTTNSTGNYTFSGLAPAKYAITGSSSNSWGGANPVDALIVNRYFIGSINTLGKLRLKAADVNKDNKINPTDAFIINKRYVGIINSFKAGDWYFETDSININCDSRLNLKGICIGDVNADRKPPFTTNSHYFK